MHLAPPGSSAHTRPAKKVADCLESSHKGPPEPSHISQHPKFSYIQMSLRADLETEWCQSTVPPSRVSSGLTLCGGGLGGCR